MLLPVFSLAFWAFMVVSSIVLYPVALVVWAVTAPFDRRLRVQHLFTCVWASLYTWFNPLWRVRVEGRERIRPDRTYVMVANHQSFLDILVLFRLFRHFKWVSKAEMFRIPCIGWNMVLNRYVRLRRGSPESIARMMTACEQHLADGSSVIIFPEGTRSPDGRLRGFKHGAFTLARKAKVPLLPIVVEGTAYALPKHGFVLRGHHAIRIRVLDEMPVDQVLEGSVEDLMSRTRALFARELGQTIDDAPATATIEGSDTVVGGRRRQRLKPLSDRARQAIARLHDGPSFATRWFGAPKWNLAAIEELSRYGEPAAIPYLAPALTSSTRRHVLAAARAVETLLAHTIDEDLPSLDESLRRGE